VTENEEKRIALRVPPELWKKWDDKRHKEEETFQGLGVRLFNEWFSGHATPLQKALSEAAVEILQKSRLSALPGIPENKKIRTKNPASRTPVIRSANLTLTLPLPFQPNCSRRPMRSLTQ
jgi:hypothetical protein